MDNKIPHYIIPWLVIKLQLNNAFQYYTIPIKIRETIFSIRITRGTNNKIKRVRKDWQIGIDRLRLRDRARFIHDRMISRDAFPISISWLFTSRYTRERWYLSKNRWSRMKIDRAKTGSENRIASIPPRQVVPLFFFFFFFVTFLLC